VNGWAAKDLFTIIAQQGADLQPINERPVALLTLGRRFPIPDFG
jgi:hypothetical protein